MKVRGRGGGRLKIEGQAEEREGEWWREREGGRRKTGDGVLRIGPEDRD